MMRGKKKMFKGIQVALIGKFKRHKHGDLKDILEKNGCIVSVNVSSNVNFVILPERIDGKRYIKNKQIKKALKESIPILKVEFIFKCLEANRMISIDKYRHRIEVEHSPNKTMLQVWYRFKCEKRNLFYYYNAFTGITQWHEPSSLYITLDTTSKVANKFENLSGEIKTIYFDDRVYYWNMITGETYYQK